MGSSGELGLTHRISFTAGFGEGKKTRKVKRAPSMVPLGGAGKPETENVLTPKLSGLSLRTPVTLNVRAELNPADKTRSRISQAVFEFQVDAGEEVDEWDLIIQDAKGKTLRRYSAQGNPVMLTWNGKDENGRVAEETVVSVFCRFRRTAGRCAAADRCAAGR